MSAWATPVRRAVLGSLLSIGAVLAAGCASRLAPAPVSVPVPAPSAVQPPAARLDHIAIAVSSVARSAAFYEAVFGLAERKNPFPGGGGVVWLDLGPGVALHIFGGRPAPVTDERERHLAITVADLSRVTGALAARGIAWQDFDGVPGRVQTRPDGVQQLFFRDLDGYWVEVNDALKTLPTRR